jgi:hypothetical protein
MRFRAETPICLCCIANKIELEEEEIALQVALNNVGISNKFSRLH